MLESIRSQHIIGTVKKSGNCLGRCTGGFVLMRYQYQDIQTISKNGLVMSDGFIILFLECNQTWKCMNNVEVSNCVGERDITADSPYFRFFMDDTIIEIRCAGKGLFKKRQNRKDFEHLRQQILQCGYTTFDLS